MWVTAMIKGELVLPMIDSVYLTDQQGAPVVLKIISNNELYGV